MERRPAGRFEDVGAPDGDDEGPDAGEGAEEAVAREVVGVNELRFEVLDELCNGCGACLKTGCPAIQVVRREVVRLPNGQDKELSYVTIDPVGCNGCDLCVQTCGPKAIVPVGLIASPTGSVELQK